MAEINAGSDGYTIYLNEARLFVTQAQSLTSSSLGTISALGSAGVSSTIFAPIGSAVGTANDSLQNSLVHSLTSCTRLLGSITNNVDSAIQAYVAADTAVAQSYVGAPTTVAQTTATTASKLGPGNEKPLPPYNVAKPTAKDYALKLELGTDGLAYLGPVKGWWNAEGMFQHYLYGDGSDYQVNPSTLMHDVPGFGQAVNNYVAGQQGTGTFDSGWINTNTDITNAQGNVTGQQSLDWYYAMHDWRYRVTGTSTTAADGSISTQYSVDVFKPYVFGSPRSDINIPYTRNLPGGPMTLQQDDIQHLNTVGLAHNFNVTGTSTFTQP
jgi:hypothetical protein